MSLNATKGRWISDDHYVIWIDRNVLENQPNGEGKVAGHYYASTINKSGHKTAGYVEKNARKVAEFIANKLGGTIK